MNTERVVTGSRSTRLGSAACGKPIVLIRMSEAATPA
jgi:hypothetical protein